jgi:hypothetical protein
MGGRGVVGGPPPGTENDSVDGKNDSAAPTREAWAKTEAIPKKIGAMVCDFTGKRSVFRKLPGRYLYLWSVKPLINRKVSR